MQRPTLQPLLVEKVRKGAVASILRPLARKKGNTTSPIYLTLPLFFENNAGCVYNQDVAKMIKNTEGMVIENEKQYAAGLFRAYTCLVE